MGGLYYAGAFTSKSVGVCYFVATVLAAVWALQRLFRQYRPRLPRALPSWPEHFRYGLRVYGVDVMSVASTQIDKVFIIGVLSLRDLGLYSVTFGLSRALGSPCQLIS